MTRDDRSSGTGDPAAELSDGLRFCLRLARGHAAMIRRLDGALSSAHGLGFGDFLILHHLGQAPGKRLRRIDLAERLGMTASGVTRSLMPLEKLGWVERQPDLRDARIGYASLTEAGDELLGFARRSVEPVADEIGRQVPDGRIGSFIVALERLAGTERSAG